MKYFYLTFIILIFLCKNSLGANIELDKNMFGNLISFKGKIDKGDFEKLLNVLKEEKLHPPEIYKLPEIRITSEGGSIEESLKIGKFIRTSLLPVTATDYCYSSCFVILISSVQRGTFGKTLIGVHRPYYDKAYFSDLSIEDANVKYKKLQESTKIFLLEMDVPTSIVDNMFNISSDNIHILTNELDKIMGRSPVYDEWIKSKCDELTDNEYSDLQSSRSPKSVNFPKGYASYLESKYQKFSDCMVSSTDKEYRRILKLY